MSYLPPRVEIYQQLQELGAVLETPLLPTCIVGPAFRVSDTEYDSEQNSQLYVGKKQTVVFNNIDVSSSPLLKRAGTMSEIFSYKLDPSGNVPEDIEIVQVVNSDDAVYLGDGSIDTTANPDDTADLSANISDSDMTIPYVNASAGNPISYGGPGYNGTFYLVIDGGTPTEEYVECISNDTPGGPAGNFTVKTRGANNTTAVAHVAAAGSITVLAHLEAADMSIPFTISNNGFATNYTNTYNVQAANPTNNTFTMNNVTGWKKGTVFVVSGTPANDGTYTVKSIAGVVVYVEETVPAAQGVVGTAYYNRKFKVKIDNEIIECSENSAPGAAAGTLTVSQRGVDGTAVTTHERWKVLYFMSQETYYNQTTKTIGNLSSLQMGYLDVGDFILKKSFGTTNYENSKSFITRVNSTNNSMQIAPSLAFTSANTNPGAANDRFGGFGAYVTVVGYVKAKTMDEDDYIPDNMTGNYKAMIIDDGIILPAGMTDRLGNSIKYGVVQTSYTSYSKTINRDPRIVNIGLLISRLSDIETYYGEIRPENPIAYGAFLALASGKAIYGVAVNSNDLVGYNNAFEQMKELPIYTVVPLTTLTEVYSSLKAHVDFMSEGAQSKWRIGLSSSENIPSEIIVVNFCIGTVIDNNGSYNRYVFNTPRPETIYPGDTLRVEDVDTPEANGDYVVVAVNTDVTGDVISVDTATEFHRMAISYDIVSITQVSASVASIVFSADPKYSVGDVIYVDRANTQGNNGWYTIAASMGAMTYQATKLSGSVSTDMIPAGVAVIGLDLTAKMFSTNSGYEIAMDAKNYAESIADRRITNLFPETVEVEQPDIIHGYFMAAAMAGYISANPGPYPFNSVTPPSIIKVFGSDDTMSYDELNLVAEGGNMIFMHNGAGSLPTCREQLTTDMSTVLTQQLSLTVNADFVSYTLKSALEPIKAKYNIDENLLNSAKLIATTTLSYFTTDLGGNRIVSFSDPEVTADTKNGCIIVRSDIKMASVGRVFKVVLNLSV